MGRSGQCHGEGKTMMGSNGFGYDPLLSHPISQQDHGHANGKLCSPSLIEGSAEKESLQLLRKDRNP